MSSKGTPHSTCPVTALVVDHHPVVRRGLACVVDQAFTFARVVGVPDGRRALALAPQLRPDLIVLEFPSTPHCGALCGQLAAAVPRARLVLMTAATPTPEIKRCLAAGAAGVFRKDTEDEDLAAALRQIMDGEIVMSPEIALRLATDLVGVLRGEEPLVRLTAREREVLDFLAEGCSNRTIADRLRLSTATVKDHVGSLMRKLEATSRLQAVARATEVGLLERPGRVAPSSPAR